ncbi:MAG TPA: hypothetical protein VL948_15055 [Verrucomicrobiae bacterium]|nr:hypothetical protein [Verrucomicrobiae bacterium]
MTGELAQTIALAAHGNAALAGDGAAGRALTLQHDAFTVVISVAFVRAGASVATTAAAWFEHLRGRGARRLVLTRLARRTDWLPDHEAVAFAGGSGVMIAADTRPVPELWAGEWRANFSALHTRERRVWDVVYHAAEPPVPVRADEPPAARYALEHARERLRSALEATIAFAGKSDWTTGFFTPALAMLGSAEVLVPARGLELLPARGYGVAARRLLAAATLAGSVFGGSGSWSDQDYGERQEAYREVSDGLFDATQAATLAAVNAFGVEP